MMGDISLVSNYKYMKDYAHKLNLAASYLYDRSITHPVIIYDLVLRTKMQCMWSKHALCFGSTHLNFSYMHSYCIELAEEPSILCQISS